MKAKVCCVAVFVVLIGAVQSEAGLTHHYPFDTDASDAAGTNDGTFIGDASIVSDPERGNVLGLDGFNDFVNLPSSNIPAGPTNTTVFSITAWLKMPPGLANNLHDGGIYGEFTGGQIGGTNFFVNENGEDPLRSVVFAQFPPSGGNIRGSFPLNDNTWHHVAYVQKFPGGFGRNIYIDGKLDVFDNALELYSGSDPDLWTMGASLSPGGNRFVQGWLDDIRFYDHALSGDEVAALVPEPSSIVLALAALCGMLVFMRRRMVR